MAVMVSHAVEIDLYGDIGYGFNSRKGAFIFESEFAIINTSPLQIRLYDARVDLYVYDIKVSSQTLAGEIQLAAGSLYDFIVNVSDSERVREIYSAFNETGDKRFDFKLVLMARASCGPYTMPIETSWSQRLGFLHYP